MSETMGDGLNDLALRYTKYAQGNPFEGTLMGARKLTIQKGSQFKKAPFIGGEQFRAAGAYVGRRGTMIFMMMPVTPNDKVDHIELSPKEAEESINGFKEHFEAFMAVDNAKAEAVAEVKAEEKATDEERQKNNELFGSW